MISPFIGFRLRSSPIPAASKEQLFLICADFLNSLQTFKSEHRQNFQARSQSIRTIGLVASCNSFHFELCFAGQPTGLSDTGGGSGPTPANSERTGRCVSKSEMRCDDLVRNQFPGRGNERFLSAKRTSHFHAQGT
jgi:hypothetical protein